jgi:hypothetical protein
VAKGQPEGPSVQQAGEAPAPGLSPEEQSITIYHEVIEVASLQAKRPPPMVLDLSEQEIDLLAKMAHEQYGLATVGSLNQLLRDLRF